MNRAKLEGVVHFIYAQVYPFPTTYVDRSEVFASLPSKYQTQDVFAMITADNLSNIAKQEGSRLFVRGGLSRNEHAIRGLAGSQKIVVDEDGRERAIYATVYWADGTTATYDEDTKKIILSDTKAATNSRSGQYNIAQTISYLQFAGIADKDFKSLSYPRM